jgi:hypothetical protein
VLLSFGHYKQTGEAVPLWECLVHSVQGPAEMPNKVPSGELCGCNFIFIHLSWLTWIERNPFSKISTDKSVVATGDSSGETLGGLGMGWVWKGRSERGWAWMEYEDVKEA